MKSQFLHSICLAYWAMGIPSVSTSALFVCAYSWLVSKPWKEQTGSFERLPCRVEFENSSSWMTFFPRRLVFLNIKNWFNKYIFILPKQGFHSLPYPNCCLFRLINLNIAPVFAWKIRSHWFPTACLYKNHWVSCMAKLASVNQCLMLIRRNDLTTIQRIQCICSKISVPFLHCYIVI